MDSCNCMDKLKIEMSGRERMKVEGEEGLCYKADQARPELVCIGRYFIDCVNGVPLLVHTTEKR